MAGGLTLAVMVRDDAKKLDRCLASMQAFVDEIVVLDTGSVDDSIAVAKNHKAAVYEIAWPNNFSTALNVVLRHVQTTWTLRLDSDEWIDPPQGKEIKELVQHKEVAGYYLIRRDLVDESGKFDEIHVLRLWRTHELVQYEGAVHEVIRHARFEEAWPGKVLLRSDAFFWHDGYVHQVKEKGRRNLEILREEARNHPEKIEARAMLATTLHGMGDPEGKPMLDAVVNELLSPSFAGPPPMQAALALAMYMELVPADQANEPKTEQLIHKVLEWFPKNPVLVFYAAVLERKRGDLERSLRLFLKVEAMADTGDYDRGMSIPNEFLGEKLYKSLGFVATKLGRQEIVRRCSTKLTLLNKG